jgi:hypothetical protein
VTDPAYAHYTVEHETAESDATPAMMRVNLFRKSWRALKHRATYRLPGPGKVPRVDADITVVVRDLVRIRDRDGGVAFEKIVDKRAAGEALHAQITSDLLELDSGAFRAKYRLTGRH